MCAPSAVCTITAARFDATQAAAVLPFTPLLLRGGLSPLAWCQFPRQVHRLLAQ